MKSKCSLDYQPSPITEGPWLLATKRINENDGVQNIDSKNEAKRRRTLYQEYAFKTRLSIKPSFDEKRNSQSILDRFRTEFHRTITNNIIKDQQLIAKRMLSIKSNHPRLSLLKFVKTNNNRLSCPNQFPTTHYNNKTTEEEKEITLTNTSQSEMTVSEMHYCNKTVNRHSFPSQSRLRTYKIPFNERWRTQIGLNIHDIKYSNIILEDLSFQYAYIRDEVNLLFENYEYYKRNFLLCRDMFLAFKNRDLRFQISHNKTIEETISLLNRIPQLILINYYQDINTIISIDSIPKEKLIDIFITDEDKCYIENENVLNTLVLFLKCCFEVYSNLTVKLNNNFTLSIEDFNVLRGILEKSRFNLTKIISESKACIKNLLFERKLIENYHDTMKTKTDKFKVNRHKLDEIIHNRFQFGKDEQSQKRKRMNKALNFGDRDDERRKIREKINNNQNAPMTMIVINYLL